MVAHVDQGPTDAVLELVLAKLRKEEREHESTRLRLRELERALADKSPAAATVCGHCRKGNASAAVCTACKLPFFN